MNKINISILIIINFIAYFFLSFSDVDSQQQDFSEIVKVSLRDVGHQLLLSNNDSTSLVLPILLVNPNSYELGFQKTLSIEPDNLVAMIKKSLEKAGVPHDYRVEVTQCVDKEVAYSYFMNDAEDTSIIPCKGRVLPKSCYVITVKFTDKKVVQNNNYYLLFFGLSTLLLLFLIVKKKSIKKDNPETSIDIGKYKFYPNENKLSLKNKDIKLSKKEGELLAIFIAQKNKIIKRDDLMKQVWEDQGVFVGRSLDTYISKLRKILKEDASIKLSNIHGVGYKLEIK